MRLKQRIIGQIEKAKMLKKYSSSPTEISQQELLPLLEQNIQNYEINVISDFLCQR